MEKKNLRLFFKYVQAYDSGIKILVEQLHSIGIDIMGRLHHLHDYDIQAFESGSKIVDNGDFTALFDALFDEIEYYICQSDRQAKAVLSEINRTLNNINTGYSLKRKINIIEIYKYYDDNITKGYSYRNLNVVDFYGEEWRKKWIEIAIDFANNTDTKQYIKTKLTKEAERYIDSVDYIIPLFTELLKTKCEDCDRLELYESIFCEDIEEPEQKGLPKELSTPEATKLLNIAVEADYLNEDYSIKTTYSQAIFIAEIISEKLDFQHKWKPFRSIWGNLNFSRIRIDNANTGAVKNQKEIEALFR